MADNLFTFLYWGLGNGFTAAQWPTPGGDLVTGGTPRYNVYRTRDGRYLAAAPLEQKFWENFLGVLGAPQLLDDGKDPAATRASVQQIIASADAAEWLRRFEGVDACVSVVKTLEEAVRSPHFTARGVFAEELDDGSGRRIPALPVPIAASLTRGATRAAPRLGDTDPSTIR
jgi:crotonobetainyl-CoA:carnitine CoA-transferase CaiB-like acyl-CoA transferase